MSSYEHQKLPPLVEDDEADIQLRQQQEEEAGFFTSCWGKLRLSLTWQRVLRLCSKRRRLRSPAYVKPGVYNYDPLSYSQNFDDWAWEQQEEQLSPHQGFSSRFVALHSPKVRK